jgi:hypothetical protein
MGLLTWIFFSFVMSITILSMIGIGWNLFISSVFRGIDKVLNGISPVARDLGNEARQYEANINKSP